MWSFLQRSGVMGLSKDAALRIVVSVSLLACVSAQWDIIEDDTCRTPEGRVGKCVVIRNCTFIVTTLQNAPRPLPSNIVQMVQRYQCGFEGSTPKVCCPPNPSVDTAMNQQPPDVAAHKNLKMINDINCGPILGNKIFGGNKTDLFEFPWMALIAYNTNNGLAFRCGGSLISNRYVLTAAHCITNLGALRLAGVRLGEHDIRNATDCEMQLGEEVCSPPHQDFEITEVVPHPQYNPTKYDNDIGLLRLGTAVDIGQENIKTICLPVGAFRTFNTNGKRMVVTGWGATESGYSSPFLLRVTVPVVANDECNRRYNRSNVRIGHRQMCAGGTMGMDSCTGDSGGPLQLTGSLDGEIKYVQHGVVSFGPRFCGTEGQPGVYTRVAFYMDWILDSLKP